MAITVRRSWLAPSRRASASDGGTLLPRCYRSCTIQGDPRSSSTSPIPSRSVELGCPGSAQVRVVWNS